MAVEASACNHTWVPRTPGDLETPLVGSGQLGNYLSRSSVWVPDQDPIVFATREKKVCVSLAPGHAEHSCCVTLQLLHWT